MATVKKFPNEKPFQRAQCDCGNTSFALLLSHSGDGRVVLFECLKCHDTIATVSDDELEIDCEFDC